LEEHQAVARAPTLAVVVAAATTPRAMRVAISNTVPYARWKNTLRPSTT
jgi:hypothetical protein